jgi:hypothetical protein
MTTTPPPPCYILLSQYTSSSLPSLGAQTLSPPPSRLIHPTIQYHYADDPPLALVPSSERPHIIILDIPDGDRGLGQPVASPSSTETIVASSAPSARSLSSALAITTVKVAQAPGAAIKHALAEGRDPNIYILETVSQIPTTAPDLTDA